MKRLLQRAWGSILRPRSAAGLGEGLGERLGERLGGNLHGWLDLLLAMLAIGGIGAAVLTDFPVRSSTAAASDLKTLYASAWCFRHGLDAYAFSNLQRVFTAQAMPVPASWYAHAPVYPPATLALLAPLTLLPMVTACWVEALGSLALMVLAVAALLRHARNVFGLPLPWRAGIAGACAAGPLLAFALSVGNLSVAASALAILAFLGRKRSPVWASALALAVALLLKPHLPLWIVAGLLLLPERRGQRVALAGVALAMGAGVALTFALASVSGSAPESGQAWRQTHSFLQMVQAETAPGGSMFAGSREALPVMAQIPALSSLLGFWTVGPLAAGLQWIVLLGFLVALCRATRRVWSEPTADLAVAGFCAFGLLMTYHRAHDAVLLLLLTPWLANRLRREPAGWRPWALLLLYAAISIGPALGATGVELLPRTPFAFLLARQAGLAALGLCAVLLLSLMAAVRPGATARALPD